jgi:hypothetical protein
MKETLISWAKLKRVWVGVLALASLLAIGASVIEIDDRYFHSKVAEEKFELLATTIENVNQRIESDKKNDKILEYQKRIWQIQDHYQGKQMPSQMKQELRFLQAELERLKRE